MLHQISAQQFYTDFGLLSTVLSPTENSRIQAPFKAFELFSSTFPGTFQESPLNSSTFQTCANPAICVVIMKCVIKGLHHEPQHEFTCKYLI